MADIQLQYPSSTPLKNIQPTEDACVRYSTRAIWHGKRNVQVDESPAGTLVYSYQNQTGEKVKTRAEGSWKVLGRGRDGKLLSWQHETPYGISDDAVVYFPRASQRPAPAEIDILCVRPKEDEDGISKETIEQIRIALERYGELGEVKFQPVPKDKAREREMALKRAARYAAWERRTGPEAGISPDLTYDDEDPKDDGKCTIQ